MSLITTETKIKVSSVHNKDTKSYGKQHLIDGDMETCWNSAENSPQRIQIEFPKSVQPNILQIMFQGGFAGKECELICSLNNAETVQDFRPLDNNELQLFKIDAEEVDKMTIVFKSSTDFYGRITIYHLDVQ